MLGGGGVAGVAAVVAQQRRGELRGQARAEPRRARLPQRRRGRRLQGRRRGRVPLPHHRRGRSKAQARAFSKCINIVPVLLVGYIGGLPVLDFLCLSVHALQLKKICKDGAYWGN